MSEIKNEGFSQDTDRLLGPSDTHKGEQSADPRLNVVIPTLIASIVFQSQPTSQLAPGQVVTKQADLAEAYIQRTSPVLEVISFHECLGVIPNLSPTVRLAIGSIVLAFNLVLLLPRRERPDKKERTEVTQPKDRQPKSEQSAAMAGSEPSKVDQE